MRASLLTVVTCVLCGQAARAEQDLGYVDLVGRLTDLERLAVLPTAGEKCMQHSSWDRGSRYDAENKTYVNWGANGDGNGYIRKKGEDLVLAEMTGPGCIWRIWSAKPEKGHLRIYLDGREKPAVDLPFIQYFDRTAKPFVYESLCYMAARGQNCYVPIPFAKSCKIVATKGWGRYYHFTYSRFPAGTKIASFALPLAPEATAALERADAFLREKMGSDPAGPRDGQKEKTSKLTVPPGKAAVAAELTGPRAVTAIRAKLRFVDRTDEMNGLRELAIRITWDGEDRPAVWAPLGDFFGTAPGVNPYRSLPLGMTDEGLYCLWYMPFAKAAKVEIVNDGRKQRTLDLHVVHAPLTRPIGRLGRFHTKWHRDAFLPRRKDRFPDWTLVTTTGRGRFVGVMLHVWNPKGGQYPPAGAARWWWGEGDEKFFVDGEAFPSTFGTGSEDYFGYAWGNGSLFARAYHCQTISSNNRGHISVNRWHFGDNVPFQTSFEGCIEKYFPNDWPTRYAALACWYLAADGTDPYPELPLSERLGWYAQPKVFRVPGAIEGEKLQVVERTGGTAALQDLRSHGLDKWSENAHVWWRDAKVGDKLTLAVPVAKAGRYEVVAAFTKANDYGIIELSLDGRPLGEPIDFYNPKVVPTQPVSLGTHDLTAGPHKLTAEIVGANPKAKKAYMFGLDYLLLKPAK